MPVLVTKDGMADLKKAVDALTKKRLLVGIPASADPRNDDSEFGNAAIGYMNEMGQPEKNIPARPHLGPGVEAAAPRAIEELRKAGVAALNGNSAQIATRFERAGMICVASVRDTIEAGLKPDLAETTIEARHRRRGLSANEKYDRFFPGGKMDPTGGEKPLEDTGGYVQALTYVVRDS